MTAFSDIPNVEHYAIIQTETIHIPGDERSRTHPGHRHPAENREVITYRVFTHRKEWEAEITKLHNAAYGCKFKAMHVRPAKIETTLSVKVD